MCDRPASDSGDPRRSPAFPGVVLGSESEIELAVKACERASAAKPDEPRYRYQLSRAYRWSGAKDKAAALLTRLVEENYVAAFAELGRAYQYGEGVGRDLARAHALYVKSSALGDPWGSLSLGLYLRHEQSPDEDYVAAVKAFEKAWTGGRAEAAVQLADAYAQGMGIPRDSARAIDFYRKADAAGDADGADGVGLSYENGWGVTRDMEEARRWYERAARLGSRWGHLHLANLMMGSPRDKDDPVQAISHYRAAAEQSVTSAQYALGNAYADGEGVAKDPFEARKWYERAIKDGSREAMNNLGALYLDGGLSRDGKTPNADMAVPLYRRAAELGNATSMLNLGNRAEYGEDGPRDGDAAIRWYEKAAFAGNSAAMVRLSQIYLNGEFGKHDPQLGYDWGRRAADLGEADGMTNIGWCYDSGLGVRLDKGKALHWYREAAKRGEYVAMNNIGAMYAEGQGVTENQLEAFNWFVKSVRASGYPLAHFNVALAYRDGEGVERDPNKAAEHVLAALEGAEARAYRSLTDTPQDWSRRTWMRLQAALAHRGYFKARVDGRPGKATKDALVALFKASGGSL